MMSVSCLVAVITFGIAPSSDEVSASIARHADSLAKIKTIYVKVDVIYHWPDRPAPQRMLTSETWKSGFQERMLQRAYATHTPHGIEVSKAIDGDVRIEAFNEKAVRSMVGWDPEHPLPTPLDFTKSVGILQRVSCSISPRDPSEMTSDDWHRLLLEVWRARPLHEVAKKAEVVPLEASNPETVRFQLKSTEDDTLLAGTYELDKQHGYLIRKRVFGNGGATEVDEFAEFPNGIWLPKHIRYTQGKFVSEITLLAARVNEEISDKDLSIDFPEGARVNDIEKRLIYLWGQGAPEKTFESDAEFYKHLQQIIQEKQGVPKRSVLVGRPIWKSPLIWANVVLIGFLAVLFAVRRRYRTQSPPPSPQ